MCAARAPTPLSASQRCASPLPAAPLAHPRLSCLSPLPGLGKVGPSAVGRWLLFVTWSKSTTAQRGQNTVHRLECWLPCGSCRSQGFIGFISGRSTLSACGVAAVTLTHSKCCSVPQPLVLPPRCEPKSSLRTVMVTPFSATASKSSLSCTVAILCSVVVVGSIHFVAPSMKC